MGDAPIAGVMVPSITPITEKPLLTLPHGLVLLDTFVIFHFESSSL